MHVRLPLFDSLQLCKALQVINSDLITPQQTEYVMTILQLVMECQRPVPDKLVKFPLFGVIAALSERIVALDDVVTTTAFDQIRVIRPL